MNLYNYETKKVVVSNKMYDFDILNENNIKLYKILNDENIFFPTISQYVKLSEDDKIIFMMKRNHPIGDSDITIKNYLPSVEMYMPLFENIDNFFIYSYPFKFNVVIDKYFDEPSNVYYIDLQNSRINGFMFVFLNVTYVEINNYTVNSERDLWFFYDTGNLLISRFVPKYENILYPFTGSRFMTYIYSEFEILNKENINYVVPKVIYDNEYVSSYDLPINRPKMLFSTDKQHWKKYDFGIDDFVDVTPDNSQYFTLTEFLQKANTYTEYLNIPKSKFGDIEWYVMMNNYIPMFCIDIPQYVMDYIGNSRMIRVYRTGDLRDAIVVWEI